MFVLLIGDTLKVYKYVCMMHGVRMYVWKVRYVRDYLSVVSKWLMCYDVWAIPPQWLQISSWNSTIYFDSSDTALFDYLNGRVNCSPGNWPQRHRPQVLKTPIAVFLYYEFETTGFFIKLYIHEVIAHENIIIWIINDYLKRLETQQ